MGNRAGGDATYPHSPTLPSQAGSRRSVQVSALLCMVLGLSPRLAGLLTHVPLAVHGGYPALPLAAAPAACQAPPDSCPLQEGCFV